MTTPTPQDYQPSNAAPDTAPDAAPDTAAPTSESTAPSQAAAMPQGTQTVEDVISNFSQATYEVVESSDEPDPLDGSTDPLSVFKFRVGASRTLRCFPSKQILRPGHWMKIDGLNCLVACAGRNCVLCETMPIDVARFIPAIDLVTLECGFIRATAPATVDGDGKLIPRRNKESFYSKLSTMAPSKEAVTYLQVNKRNETTYDVTTTTAMDEPSPEFVASFHARLHNEQGQILQKLFEFYTDEQLRAMPVVQRALKLKTL